MNLMSSIEGRRGFLRERHSAARARRRSARRCRAYRLWLSRNRKRLDRGNDLARDVFLFSGAGGNVLLLADSQGGVLVDSGSAEGADSLLERVSARLGGRSVDVLFNTHWHLDHTGGNEAFAKTGARIIAHENTRLWMSTEYYVDWQDRTYPPRPAAALPTETF